MIKEVAFPRHLNSPNLQIPVKNRFDDLVQRRMHIASCLIDNPSNTFYFEVDDDQMQFFGIVKKSIVVIDNSLQAKSGSLILCCVNDEWLLRKLIVKDNNRYLLVNNNYDACLNITGRDFKIFGIVTWICCPQSL